jgi:hypothetical protein
VSGKAAALHAHNEAVHQLHTIAKQLKRAQAETPLCDQAESLLSSPDKRLTIALLGLDPACKPAALSWVTTDRRIRQTSHNCLKARGKGGLHMGRAQL